MRATLCFAVAVSVLANSYSLSAADFGWWRSEYPSLLARLSIAPGRHLQAAYTVEDKRQVILDLRQLENQSVLLIVDGPGESVMKIDETGQLVHGSGRIIFFITDSDRDGMPDTFTSGPSRSNQSAPRRISVEDDAAVPAVWGVGIGYSTNWFLHNRRSASPP